MFVVDRDDFRAWIKNRLAQPTSARLETHDERGHDIALGIMRRGRQVGLIKNGRIVSHMRLINGVFKEIPLET